MTKLRKQKQEPIAHIHSTQSKFKLNEEEKKTEYKTEKIF